MAFYDDRKFLLSHIHHSFITCDDTGMCEMAMLNELVTDKALNLDESDKPEFQVLDYYSESDLLESGQSYNIVSGMSFIGGHRHRSNTAQRLEKLKKDKQNQARITRVPWKECATNLTEQELKQLFPKKDLSNAKESKGVVKSALSEALELCPDMPNNPFGEYTRFDGRVTRSAPSKKILIYLTMLPTSERNFGMEVVCLSSARVQDLIGLICWMYTNEGKEPKLKPSLENYCLKIAEETGEVDEDFPSLDANEFVGKFGFPYLALIEKESPGKVPLSVTMMVEEESIKFEVPSLDLSLREVANLISHRIPIRKSKAYQIEKIDDPGVAIPLETKLANTATFVFRMVFELDSSEKMQKDLQTDEYDAHMRAVEAPLYRSYSVTLCQKMGMNYDVQLGISGEKVEINPLPQKGAAKLLTRQQKPATLYTDAISTCEIIAKKYNPGKCIFKLVYLSGSEFKKHVFETDPQTAQDIVKKLQIILEMHSTNAAREYQRYREQKLQRKLQKSQQSSKS